MKETNGVVPASPPVEAEPEVSRPLVLILADMVEAALERRSRVESQQREGEPEEVAS